jgi:hypothetical protein
VVKVPMRDYGECHTVDAPGISHGVCLLPIRPGVNHDPPLVGRPNQNPVGLTSVDDLNSDGLELSTTRQGAEQDGSCG